MTADIIIIGGGASGMMAAYSAAAQLAASAFDSRAQYSVVVLESMPRPGRKIMVTGKGRCNFTNAKDWNEFSPHVRANSAALRPSFYNLTPAALIDWFGGFGMESVVERGERAFPASHRSSDVVDALVRACNSVGVKLLCGAKVVSASSVDGGFEVSCEDGGSWKSRKLVIATGGLSYPSTGSTGDGYLWAESFGHRIVPTFPSLTALVPKGYKAVDPGSPAHIDRSTPLAELGEKLCGVSLKNVQLSLELPGSAPEVEFGDVDFTDGGLEGPIGFALSRRAVKAMVNGSRAAVVMDLKPQVPLSEFTARVKQLKEEVWNDPRSRRISDKEKTRILLGKLMPWELIPGFRAAFPSVGHDAGKIAASLKAWSFEIAGYVGYERAVVTAGGVSLEGIVPKTMESRLVKGLYFCGEVLDIDADTGGYNLHSAFCTGALAGLSAAKSL